MEKRERYPEIDLARGIAFVMMILFHTLFDISFFGIVPVQVYSGFWWFFAYGTATPFLLIVGSSLTISRTRASTYLDEAALNRKFLLLRGSGIIGLGLLVTLAARIFLREGYVIFGILFVLGVAVCLSPLFFRFRKWNALTGLLIVMIGWIVAMIPGPIWLLPVGIHPPFFWSVDYTPIFPWLGVVLIGTALGYVLYPDGIRCFTISRLPETGIAPLLFLGRHSHLLYHIHQPVILAILFALTGMPAV